MKLNYYPETDQLYIDLADGVAAETIEVAPDFLLDLDSTVRVIGIDIDHSRGKVDLERVVLSRIPGAVQTVANVTA